MWKYYPVQESVCDEDGRVYITYGIRAENAAGETVAHVADVSTNRRFVARLAQRCERGELDPEQLRDVILDSLP